jgi:hypothetical protein
MARSSYLPKGHCTSRSRSKRQWVTDYPFLAALFTQGGCATLNVSLEPVNTPLVGGIFRETYLHSPMVETSPLVQAAAAYDHMLSGNARFRVVLTMNE